MFPICMKAEKWIVKLFSFLFSRIRIPGSYRVATLFYPYYVNYFQKGVWLTAKYLSPQYGLLISLFSKDLIDHKILFTGSYEQETNSILEKYLTKDFFVVEAGANSGTETLLISRLIGNEGRVFAFEPVPHLIEKLNHNIKINELQNIQVEQLALGEKNEEIHFFTFPIEHPNQGMGSKLIDNKVSNKIRVNQITLDSFVLEINELNRLDFLKMDVQGAEIDILRGGRETLLKFKPMIFLEAGEGWSDVLDLYTYLEGLGYKIYGIGKRQHLLEISRETITYGNWLALPEDQ